jgi:hypothetical protein
MKRKRVGSSSTTKLVRLRARDPIARKLELLMLLLQHNIDRLLRSKRAR